MIVFKKIVLCGMLSLLGGCTIESYVVNRAIELCKDRGGVSSIDAVIGIRTIWCMDGTVGTNAEARPNPVAFD